MNLASTRFGITMGDPCGIGPEIIIKALEVKPSYINKCIVFGSYDLLIKYSNMLDSKIPICKIASPDQAEEEKINVI